MGLSRSGTLFLIGLLVLIALSLQPMASVETAVNWAFAPSRVLAELARPFAWLSRSTVSATEKAATDAFELERDRSHALLFASQSAALPVAPALLSGRAAVACDVIGSFPKNRDRLRLRFAVDAGVVPGSPVVRGDAYVGRVIELDPERRGECIAELVTAKDFRVSAIVEDTTPPARFVVGGVLGKTTKDDHVLHLAVQFPSDRRVVGGAVRVLEENGSRDAALADGFLLGELGWVDVHGTKLFGIRAPLDYAFGLGHLAILVPPERGTAGPVLPIDPFDAACWMDARVILAGDASATRDTRRLALTTSSSIAPGAALGIGARFVGRVERVGPIDSTARLLADPGLAFSALARIEGQSAPIALGQLVSLGSDGADFVLFACSSTVKLEGVGNGAVRIELWTAPADPDLPPGLLVGEGVLDAAHSPVTVRIRPAIDARQLQQLRVWRGRPPAKEDDP